jgi:hypothetical protein
MREVAIVLALVVYLFIVMLVVFVVADLLGVARQEEVLLVRPIRVLLLVFFIGNSAISIAINFLLDLLLCLLESAGLSASCCSRALADL